MLVRFSGIRQGIAKSAHWDPGRRWQSRISRQSCAQNDHPKSGQLKQILLLPAGPNGFLLFQESSFMNSSACEKSVISEKRGLSRLSRSLPNSHRPSFGLPVLSRYLAKPQKQIERQVFLASSVSTEKPSDVIIR